MDGIFFFLLPVEDIAETVLVTFVLVTMFFTRVVFVVPETLTLIGFSISNL